MYVCISERRRRDERRRLSKPQSTEANDTGPAQCLLCRCCFFLNKKTTHKEATPLNKSTRKKIATTDCARENDLTQNDGVLASQTRGRGGGREKSYLIRILLQPRHEYKKLFAHTRASTPCTNTNTAKVLCKKRVPLIMQPWQVKMEARGPQFGQCGEAELC